MPDIAVRPANPRRAPLHPAITEAMIEDLVRSFYAKVRLDPELAPIFDQAIPDDWEPHLETMIDFWSSVTRMTGRFKGQPVPKHRALDRIAPHHFERWLGLFRTTADEICPPEIAALFTNRAEKIADNLKRAVFGNPA